MTTINNLALYNVDTSKGGRRINVKDIKRRLTSSNPVMDTIISQFSSPIERCTLYTTKPILTINLADLQLTDTEKQALVETVAAMHKDLNNDHVLSMKNFQDGQLEVYSDGTIHIFDTKATILPNQRAIANSAHIGTMGQPKEVVVITKLAPDATSQFKFVGSSNDADAFQSVANKLATAIKRGIRTPDLSRLAVRTNADSFDKSFLSSRKLMSSLAVLQASKLKTAAS